MDIVKESKDGCIREVDVGEIGVSYRPPHAKPQWTYKYKMGIIFCGIRRADSVATSRMLVRHKLVKERFGWDLLQYIPYGWGTKRDV